MPGGASPSAENPSPTNIAVAGSSSAPAASTAPVPTSPAGPRGTGALDAERAHLRLARTHLARMRERTLSLHVQGGNEVSAQYLAATLYHRAAALADDPSTSLFFGRTDHLDGATWYIGRRHVADGAGDPMVIDWRADVARAFYRASRTDPQGVHRRRRFGIEHGEITAYEDEHLTDPAEEQGRSAILAREIERPRVGPMRDIVATIQPEQDEIVRADLTTTVCVQGAPGTGKTAVGLHRAAWLLYAFRDRLSRSGVLVIGPNASFLAHVGAVLPALGEADVRHATVEELVRTGGPRPVRVRGTDPVEVAALKGDARLAQVLHTAVWSHPVRPADALVLPRGVRRWRLPVPMATDVVEELRRRGVRYAAARDMLPQRFAHALLVQMEEAGESPDDRVQDAVARSREVRRYVDRVWPALTPEHLLWRLLGDPDFLGSCADGVLSPAEQRLLLWPGPPRTPGAARWSPADAVLLDELSDLLRRTPSLGHVVLDEAQDLSPMQLRAVGRRCSTGSATALGDIAQGTTPWATPSWETALHHLGLGDAVLTELDRGFRVPAAVITFAGRMLPLIAPGLTVPTSVRDDPGSLVLRRVPEPRRWQEVTAAVRSCLTEEGSIGVIVPDAWIRRAARALAGEGIAHEVLDGEGPAGPEVTGSTDSPATPARVVLVPATTAKGLEYDRVVVVEPAAIAAAEPDPRTGLRRLYVVLTRAVSGLVVVHSDPLPGPLAT